MKNNSKNKFPYKFFGALFLLIISIMIIGNLLQTDVLTLQVPNNAGVSFLETVDDLLVCVFLDGQVAVWDWNTLPEQQAGFSVPSSRVILPDGQHVTAINENGKQLISVYDLLSGDKQKDITAGYADQEVWPRISFDKSALALIRRNPVNAQGDILYEFMNMDIDDDFLGLPVSVALSENVDDFIDYSIDSQNVLFAAGSSSNIGRLAAANLEIGTVLWDRTYNRCEEFCNVIVSPDNRYLLAGNRNGVLYKINAETGEIIKAIHLLEEGETRQVTNEYSVLNLAFSPDGQYYVVTINPKAYFLKAGSDDLLHVAMPANRQVSRIAFSPDNHFFATSDIRAGYPIKVWPMSLPK